MNSIPINNHRFKINKQIINFLSASISSTLDFTTHHAPQNLATSIYLKAAVILYLLAQTQPGRRIDFTLLYFNININLEQTLLDKKSDKTQHRVPIHREVKKVKAKGN